MNWPLFNLLPSNLQTDQDTLSRFLEYIAAKKLELYPAQEEAILELSANKNVILNTPTGSGKSLVASFLHFHSLSMGRRSFYTSPIKALVNEKFLALCKDFGPEQVGMITGDGSVNPSAPIICCTAEILALDALRFGANASIDDVVMDEFHYYSDRERGVAWQIPLLALSKTRFLLMSATLGDTPFFEKALTDLNGRETILVQSEDRPVPLEFIYQELPLHETISRLFSENKVPVYLVNFTQREAAETAQDLLSTDFCSKEEKKRIAEALQGSDFNSPYGKDIQRLLKHGIGLHHGGLLPKYRILAERLAQMGLLKLICGTDTLGVGVNIPIRTVLFTKLCKFDGEKTSLLSVRDFKQISGRAGRRGFDNQGTVVVQAPEHVIENKKMESKSKKFVKRKPPEKGFLPWNQETFHKLRDGQPEALTSRFQVSHGMVISVLARKSEDGCKALQKLINSCHEPTGTRKKLKKHAFTLFRSLVSRNIIEIKPELRIHVDLQEDFSLHHVLALYLIDAIQALDLHSPSFSLDLLTLVESILENPDLILRKQIDRLKTQKIAELKAQGMEYDQRMEELEKIEYPKPNSEFIYQTFNAFSEMHPWVGQENIRPKSVAREMVETFQSFHEYIRDYDLQRVEGLLLRYLTEVYKVLTQTVPDYAKTEEVFAIEEYFGTMLKAIDSSLLQEWEKLRNPGQAPLAVNAGPNPEDLEKLRKTERVRHRNEVFRIVRSLSQKDYPSAAELLRGTTPGHLEKELEPFFAVHSRILTDPMARAPAHYRSTEDGQVEQVLCDPEGHHDWVLRLKRTPDAIEFISVGPL